MIISSMFYLKKLKELAFDLLFPSPSHIQTLEKMTASEFRKEAVSSYAENPLSDRNIHSLFPYRSPLVKEVIWQIKYKGNLKVATLLSSLLHEEIIAELENEDLFYDFKNPLLIPIPISKKRLKKRGYNQMELIGKELQSIDQGRSFEFSPSLLCKIKDTLPQTMMKDRRLRLNNLFGCFEIKNPEKILGRNIILIDDVFTTGSTISEAKNTLMRAGAKKVIAFTLAH